MTKSNIINYHDSKVNMYGCFPCPKCSSKHRYPILPAEDERREIVCDDCGYEECCDEENSDE